MDSDKNYKAFLILRISYKNIKKTPDFCISSWCPTKMLKLSLAIIERGLSVIHLNIDYDKKNCNLNVIINFAVI